MEDYDAAIILEEDYDIMTRINKNQQLKQWQRLWREDLDRYLIRNLEGKCDSGI